MARHIVDSTVMKSIYSVPHEYLMRPSESIENGIWFSGKDPSSQRPYEELSLYKYSMIIVLFSTYISPITYNKMAIS